MRIDKHKSFITEEERLSLLSWVSNNKDTYFKDGISRGRGGYKLRATTRLFEGSIDYPDLVSSIQSRIMELYNIPDNLVEKLGGSVNIIVITKPKGDTYSHTDPILNKGHAVRFNIVLQEADEGGLLFVNNRQIKLSEKELHCYCATRWEHSVSEVRGDTDRVIIIFGFEIGDDWERGEWPYKIAQDGPE